jgi:polygalacturonase
LIGSTDINEYTSGHLIYAKDAVNVGIVGNGSIDGQGASFWKDKELGEDVMWRKGWGEVSHYYKACFKRPERLVRFSGCKNVFVRHVLLKNSANWTLHILACDEVSIEGIRIHNPLEGPNTDGIDIDSSQNVSISDCKIVTGDDAIVLKNTNIEERKQTTRNITVTNCVLTTPCNAFKIGTESQLPVYGLFCRHVKGLYDYI